MMPKQRHIGLLAWLVVTVMALVACSPNSVPTQVANRVLGRDIGSLPLRRLNGDSVTVQTACAGSACALFFVGVRDCLDCLNYPAELRIIRSRFSRVRAFIVGTGTDTAFFHEYFDRQRLPNASLLDPERVIGSVVASSHTPIAMLVAADGTVLFVDTRSGPEAAGAPVSKVMLKLLDTFDQMTTGKSRWDTVEP